MPSLLYLLSGEECAVLVVLLQVSQDEVQTLSEHLEGWESKTADLAEAAPGPLLS